MGWDITGLYEQNGILAIGTMILFCTYRDCLGHVAWDYETAALAKPSFGITTMPHYTRTLNGKSSMLLREHNPVYSLRNKLDNLIAF